MSRCNHATVIRLYRSLLRLGRRWPAPQDRLDRSMGIAICSKTKELFLKHKDVPDSQVKRLGEYGVSELKALRRLTGNVHFQAVRTSPFFELGRKFVARANGNGSNAQHPLGESSKPKYMRDIREKGWKDGVFLLSSKYQAQEQKKSWGMDMKMLKKLFKDWNSKQVSCETRRQGKASLAAEKEGQ